MAYTFHEGELLTAQKLNDAIEEARTEAIAAAGELTVAASWFYTGFGTNSKLTAYKRGRTVHLSGVISLSGSAISSGLKTNVVQLPSNVIPAETRIMPAIVFINGSTNPYQSRAVIHVKPDRYISIYIDASITAVTAIQIEGDYLL